ncbi:hypothetical protein E2C01_002152 [Portunus trituberculatus]|uniref:Uncharacterized protein n=1 Tax=Portunus trituberculatus TaxID=210409 RepID=A0A5B7CK82_PORTR|nr:hypothetical protein [Portunus trituberculatus]
MATDFIVLIPHISLWSSRKSPNSNQKEYGDMFFRTFLRQFCVFFGHYKIVWHVFRPFLR